MASIASVILTLRSWHAESKAKSNLELARQVVDEMYISVADQLENVPRMDDYQRASGKVAEFLPARSSAAERQP